MPKAEQGTIIAIDYGLKKIGLACGDSALKIAHPLMSIKETNRQKKIDLIAALICEWHPIYWVVGVPFHPDGSDNEFTKTCLKFAHALAKKTNLNVHLIDERYSSCYAESLLSGYLNSRHKRKKAIDQIAAQAILDAFFHEGSYHCISQ